MKRNLKIALGFLLSAFLLFWLFRSTRWAEVFEAMRHADVRWLLLSQGCLLGSIFARVDRWKYIVRAVQPASYRALFSATQIGLLANCVLPGRVGELVRAAVLSRLERFPFARGVALVALDRVTDLVGLIAIALIALIGFHPHHDIQLPPELFVRPIPANVMGTAVKSGASVLAVFSVVLVMLYVNQRLVVRIADAACGLVSRRLRDRVHAALQHFAEGLLVLQSAWRMTMALLFSILTWLCFVGAMACMLQAFHLDWPWYTPFLMQAITAVAISLPAAPAFVGQFHAGILASVLMAVPAAPVAEIKAIAIVTHVLFLVPSMGAGVYCLLREQLSLGELKRNSAAVEETLTKGMR